MDKDKKEEKEDLVEKSEPNSSKEERSRPNSNESERSSIAKKEEEILKFWQENKIFEKSLEKDAPNGGFVFYDGPPFATGLPHYGHILAGTIKDVIPRYKTMRGYHVPRRWGWDCHGLPLENQIEEELGLESKKDIEKFGVERFNETAKDFVLRYADDWKEIIPRTGRWVDMENDYRTMDWYYTESIWWAFKELYDKDLIYEGFKSMHVCPRCETPLSNFEVNQGYKDIKDLAVTVELPLKDEEKTSILVWTTTPWTLPGNMAAAVNEELSYTKVLFEGKNYIVASELVGKIFEGKDHEVSENVSAKDLIGKEYDPPFDYFKNEEIENKENAWKIYSAPYVTTEEGTGIVHLAPAFGAEDLELAQKEGIPIVHHVDEKGNFTEEVTDLAGKPVKPKEDHMSQDIEIIKILAGKEVLFDKEKITHSYPLCWRCDTPLLNYATSSWFVGVTDIKEKLISENKKVGWVPKAIGENRFGDWLEGARDWAISRARYWGAPMPVWKCEDCDDVFVPGSAQELKEKTVKSGNNYFVMRHAESEGNGSYKVNYLSDVEDGLTDKGREQVKEALPELKKLNIDLIIHSPLQRTKETAEMTKKGLGLGEDQIAEDERIGELRVGEFQGKSWSEYHEEFSLEEQFTSKPEGDSETRMDAKRRSGDFLYDIENQYEGKNILIVTHEGIYEALLSVVEGADLERSMELVKGHSLNNAEMMKLDFAPIPHNSDYELDFHLPYIDEVDVKCSCGGAMERIPEVFDCWFESGSMSFAQKHHPFENLDEFNPKKNKGYPADFIAEGLDQTRGWFYSSLVLGAALFDESPYKNVIVNGLILAEDGQKMSKRLKNYPDPGYVMNKYGADAMRYYMISSPVVRSEDLAFSEKGVDEVVKKLILRLTNTYNFLEMYDAEGLEKTVVEPSRKNILDEWILSRLGELINKVTKELDGYYLDRSARPFIEFLDDFSTWYIRRSRDRFRSEDLEDKEDASNTTRYVLREVSKLLAPFTPFVAEDIYRKVGGEKESVHLEDWPKIDESLKIKDESGVLESMQEVRNVVSLALEARADMGIKVRQPLSQLKVKSSKLKEKEEYVSLIKDEVNVKEVVFDDSITEEVELETEITPDLKREGQAREIIRKLQSMRKKAGLSPEDEVLIEIETDESGRKVIEEHDEDIKNTAGIKEIRFSEGVEGEEFDLSDISLKLKIK